FAGFQASAELQSTCLAFARSVLGVRGAFASLSTGRRAKAARGRARTPKASRNAGEFCFIRSSDPLLLVEMTIFYDPSCLEYSSPEHPERPERIARTAPFLKDRHPDWEWHEPRAATNGELLRAHSRQHIEHVASAREDFDLDTPLYPKIDTYGRHSAGAAIEAARA